MYHTIRNGHGLPEAFRVANVTRTVGDIKTDVLETQILDEGYKGSPDEPQVACDKD